MLIFIKRSKIENELKIPQINIKEKTRAISRRQKLKLGFLDLGHSTKKKVQKS